ncbi:DUF3798 domain-containing protein [Peptostreptococcus faecalis]|uniref:DUF3798 domain-containing protein n=1 Tax=Peptostreptococcus faecalis TaxID=2045015 RepID=UPI000C7CDFD9|nr:DUF3798 domain-containing protein [Peptostreptococcus faecalis]
MNKVINNLKKILILFSCILLVGCSGSNEGGKKTEINDANEDKNTKVAIITQSEDDNKKAYDSAKSLKLWKDYNKEKNDKYKAEIKHFILPSNYENSKKDVEKIFKDIEKDKSINVVVMSSNKKGILPYAKELKEKRNDIITISAQLTEDDKELINEFDLNFKTKNNSDRGAEISELAKSLGAEKFFYFVREDKLNDEKTKKIIENIQSESKKLDMPVEEIKIPESDSLQQKKAYVSNKVDELVEKYGNKINIYSTDKGTDEVLINKLVDKKFYIAELSEPNSSQLIMKLYGINQISRLKEDYDTLNQQVSAFYKSNYNIERTIGSASADPESFLIKFATELGINLNGKKMELNTAYNSYFLEKVSFVRCKTYSAFENKYEGVGNFKVVMPDQIVY